MLRSLVRVLSVVVISIVLLVTLVLTWLWWVAQEAPRHLERKGKLVSFHELAPNRLRGSDIREFRLLSDSGLVVELSVRIPDRLLADQPLLMMLGGQETGRAAVELVPDTRGVVLAAISYPFGTVPHRSLLAMTVALPRIQQGIFDTPAAALLALEFLLGPGSPVVPGRVELAGVSFGAYLAAVPAVLDARVERLWLVHGGAEPAVVFDWGLRDRVWPAALRRAIASYLASVAGTAHLAPAGWLQRLPPRPVVLIHARDDSALPESAAGALSELAQSPREILWTEGSHVHPKRPSVVSAISDLMFLRIGCGKLAAEACSGEIPGPVPVLEPVPESY